jgi:hypothetical protein
MTPISINKISIQGIKGTLHPIDLSLGKASSPHSLAIFAPNACGKSGIADALEYYFDEEGRVEHLGIKANSETGGKAAIPHIHAQKEKIIPTITVTFHGGFFNKAQSIKREVKTGLKDDMASDIAKIVDSARAVRILRQHDLRKFVVDLEPAGKYQEISRWVGLEKLDTLREQLTKAQNDFNKKNKQKELDERLVDIKRLTDGKVTTASTKELIGWINNERLKAIGVSTSLSALDDTKALFDELDQLQEAEDKKLGIDIFTKFLASFVLQKNDKGEIISFKEFSFPNTVTEFRNAFIKLDSVKSSAKDSVFKTLWETALPLLEKDDVTSCPLCYTSWDKTKCQSRQALLDMTRKNLETLKSVSEAEAAAEKCRQTVLGSLRDAQKEMSLILERSKSAKLNIADDVQKAMTDSLTFLLNAFDQAKCQVPSDIPESSTWESSFRAYNKMLLDCIMKANAEIKALEGAVPDSRRFQKAKDTIAEIIVHKTRYDHLSKLQREYEQVGDALAIVSSAIRDAIKNQMKKVLEILKNDISNIYKKVHGVKEAPEIFIDVPDDRSASLFLRISFYDSKEPVPPGGYLSESFINTLGIAVFLAAVKNFNAEFPFIVLDDIVSSHDADHRLAIVNVIAEDFSDYQIILMTHDHLFFRQLKHRLEDKNWRFRQIKHWEVSKGPVFADDISDDQSIERLFDDKINHQRAGQAVRQAIEEWFDKKCSNFIVYTPHKSGMQDYKRTLFDYWEPFIKKVCGFGSDMPKWLDSQVCYQRLKSSELINYYSHHQTNPYEWGTMGDVEATWNNFKEFRNLFVCVTCSGKLSYVFGDKKPYCTKCGEWPKP